MTALNLVPSLDRSMPHSTEFEREVLGSVLWSSKTFDRVRPIIGPDDFFHDAHRRVFDAMCIEAENGPVEKQLLIECLRNRNELEKVGGVGFIEALYDMVPNSAQIEKYAEGIRKASILRKVIAAGHAVTQAAMEAGAEPEGVLADLELSLSNLRASEREGSRDLAIIVSDAIKASEERVARGELLGIRTSLDAVNLCLLGYQRGALTVLAANTSIGKTAFGIQAVEDAVRLTADVRAVSYQAEMTEKAVAYRFMARNTRVSLDRIRDWKCLSDFEKQSIQAYSSRLREFKRRLMVAAELRSLSGIVADMKFRKAEDGLDMVVVDYLQLIDGGADEQTREREISRVAWRMVEVAHKLDIAVLALSQVTGTGGRLTTDSLRESKAIGHHARNVLILDRPRQSNKEDLTIAKCYTVLQVEKQSEGDTGDYELHFDGRYQIFTDGGCPTGCPTKIQHVATDQPETKKGRKR